VCSSKTTAGGSRLPEEITVTEPLAALISVRSKNSSISPVTSTRSPIATLGGSPVKTQMPSDVSSSPSLRAVGVCMKKPTSSTPFTRLLSVATA